MITTSEAAPDIFRPPAFDKPSATGFLDDRSGARSRSDCSGALQQAVPDDAADLSEAELREGQVFGGAVDAPSLHKVDRAALARELDDVRRMDPKSVLSSHLPAARGMTDRLPASFGSVPDAPPFVGPNQAGLGRMVLEMAGGPQQFA